MDLLLQLRAFPRYCLLLDNGQATPVLQQVFLRDRETERFYSNRLSYFLTAPRAFLRLIDGLFSDQLYREVHYQGQILRKDACRVEWVPGWLESRSGVER